MSLDYYTRNLDQLQTGSRCGTPRNAVLDVLFPDEQISIDNPSGLENVVYTATGGETSFQNDALISADVISVTRDGVAYTPVESFSVAPKKEFIHDTGAGTISYHTGLPVMETGEDNIAIYVPSGASAVVTEPTTLQQAKDWMKVEVDDDDAIITALIPAARRICEGHVSKSFVVRTVTVALRNDLGNIRLPYGPVDTITSITDVDGNAFSSYTLTGVSDKRLLEPRCSYIKVVYTAGFTSLPEQFKTALKMQIAWMYQNRGDVALASGLSPEAQLLLNPFRSVV